MGPEIYRASDTFIFLFFAFIIYMKHPVIKQKKCNFYLQNAYLNVAGY